MDQCKHKWSDLKPPGAGLPPRMEEEDHRSRRHHQHHVQSVFVIGHMPMARRNHAMSLIKIDTINCSRVARAALQAVPIPPRPTQPGCERRKTLKGKRDSLVVTRGPSDTTQSDSGRHSA